MIPKNLPKTKINSLHPQPQHSDSDLHFNQFKNFQFKNSPPNDSGSGGLVKYSDVEKFLEKRTAVESNDDIIEIDEDD